MKSIILLALLNVNGVDYRLNTEFFNTQEQCQAKVATCNKRVGDLTNSSLKLELKAKCYYITPEVESTDEGGY